MANISHILELRLSVCNNSRADDRICMPDKGRGLLSRPISSDSSNDGFMRKPARVSACIWGATL